MILWVNNVNWTQRGGSSVGLTWAPSCTCSCLDAQQQLFNLCGLARVSQGLVRLSAVSLEPSKLDWASLQRLWLLGAEKRSLGLWLELHNTPSAAFDRPKQSLGESKFKGRGIELILTAKNCNGSVAFYINHIIYFPKHRMERLNIPTSADFCFSLLHRKGTFSLWQYQDHLDITNIEKTQG